MLTQAHLAAWEKAKGEKAAQGECESAWPGDWGAQDTFSVGPLKGVGRIDQPTFLAPSSTGAFANLYDRTTSLTAAALRNDQGAPCVAPHEIPLSRLLTDRGTA